jgi:uncharacterized membrane protein (UPF0127 family)
MTYFRQCELRRLTRFLVFIILAMSLVSCAQLERIFSTSENTELTEYRAIMFAPDSMSIKSEYLLYTAIDKKEGLLSFDNLDEDEGMIFLYKNRVDHPFTMKGMKFNIDIVFLARVNGMNGDKYLRVVHIEPNAIAGEAGFASPHQYDAVLEIPADQATASGIMIGDEMFLSKESLINANFLNHDTGSSYVLGDLVGNGVKVTDTMRSDLHASFNAATEIMQSKEFKKSLLVRLSRRGWDRLATESSIAIKDVAVHEGRDVKVNLTLSSTVPSDAITGCSNAQNGKVDISLNPNVFAKGTHYLTGTIAHELTHHIGNSYGDNSCYVDSGIKTKLYGFFRSFVGHDKVKPINRMSYIVGGLACEMSYMRSGLDSAKCPTG